MHVLCCCQWNCWTNFDLYEHKTVIAAPTRAFYLTHLPVASPTSCEPKGIMCRRCCAVAARISSWVSVQTLSWDSQVVFSWGSLDFHFIISPQHTDSGISKPSLCCSRGHFSLVFTVAAGPWRPPVSSALVLRAKCAPTNGFVVAANGIWCIMMLLLINVNLWNANAISMSSLPDLCLLAIPSYRHIARARTNLHHDPQQGIIGSAESTYIDDVRRVHTLQRPYLHTPRRVFLRSLQACSACTFLNDKSQSTCEICSTRRPPPPVRPARSTSLQVRTGFYLDESYRCTLFLSRDVLFFRP